MPLQGILIIFKESFLPKDFSFCFPLFHPFAPSAIHILRSHLSAILFPSILVFRLLLIVNRCFLDTIHINKDHAFEDNKTYGCCNSLVVFRVVLLMLVLLPTESLLWVMLLLLWVLLLIIFTESTVFAKTATKKQDRNCTAAVHNMAARVVSVTSLLRFSQGKK